MFASLLVLLAVVSQAATPRGTVTFPDGTKVSVEIADTEPVRMQGLMFRDRLAPADGMVFVFPEAGHYPFWMKNTRIPLDILWLDADRRVRAIAPSVPPCAADPCPSYPPLANGRPVQDALYVVEVVSGFARRHGVAVGDTLTFSNIPSRGR